MCVTLVDQSQEPVAELYIEELADLSTCVRLTHLNLDSNNICCLAVGRCKLEPGLKAKHHHPVFSNFGL